MTKKIIASIEDDVQTVELGIDSYGWLYMSINGLLQFNEADEYRYHQSLFLLPYLMHEKENPEVLILGGGDGLGARDLIRAGVNPKNITVVDISPAVIFLAKENKYLRKLNEDSMRKVNVVVEDAFEFVKKINKKYDIIVLDYPDPSEDKEDQVNRLFSSEHIEDVKKLLAENGVISMQAGAPLSAPNTYTKIVLNFSKLFKNVLPFNVYVSVQFQLGGVIASDNKLVLRKKIPEWTFYDEETLQGLFVFFKDERPDLPREEIEKYEIHELVKYDRFRFTSKG